jgi:hypothetical protein
MNIYKKKNIVIRHLIGADLISTIDQFTVPTLICVDDLDMISGNNRLQWLACLHRLLDMVNHSHRVAFVGVTNLESIDHGLKMIYIPVPSLEQRKNIIELIMKRNQLQAYDSIDRLNHVSDTFSYYNNASLLLDLWVVILNDYFARH